MKGMRRLWELAADLAARRHQEATASYWYKQLAQQQFQQNTYQQQLGQMGSQPTTWTPTPSTNPYLGGITTTTGGSTLTPVTPSYYQYNYNTPPTPPAMPYFTSTDPNPQSGHDSSDFQKCQHPDCVLVRNWEPLLAGGDDSKDEDHGQDESQ